MPEPLSEIDIDNKRWNECIRSP